MTKSCQELFEECALALAFVPKEIAGKIAGGLPVTVEECGDRLFEVNCAISSWNVLRKHLALQPKVPQTIH